MMQSKVVTTHVENCANRFYPTPVVPFPKYRTSQKVGGMMEQMMQHEQMMQNAPAK